MTCGLCKKPIRGDEQYVTDHYRCAADMDQSWAADVKRAEEKYEELARATRTILRGFEQGVFCRDTSGDGVTGWAIQLLPYVAALSEAQKLSATVEEGATVAAVDPSVASQHEPTTRA